MKKKDIINMLDSLEKEDEDEIDEDDLDYDSEECDEEIENKIMTKKNKNIECELSEDELFDGIEI
ncbi:MAG: hypothetical protein GY739_11565 [Mesoflavibacter sp.]|nr:hypothetical protein [Mesoflavibacter sp.]